MGPNVNMDWRFLVAAVIGVIVLVEYTKSQVGGAAKAVGNAIDPTNKDNAAAKAGNALTKAITLRDSDTTGFAVWRMLNPDKAAQLDQYLKK